MRQPELEPSATRNPDGCAPPAEADAIRISGPDKQPAGLRPALSRIRRSVSRAVDAAIAAAAVFVWRRLARPERMLRWLTALSLVVSAGILAIGIGIILDLRAEAWDRAERQADNLVLTLSRDIERNIGFYDLSLQGSVKAIALPGLDQVDPTIRQMALFDAAASAEYLGNMLVANANGEVIAASGTTNGQPMNIAFREHFRVHKDRADVGLYISRPFEGRLMHESVIALTRRINNPDGSFGGIVEGVIRTDYFRHLFEQLQLGQRDAILMVRTDGRVIMRRPFRPEEIDRDLSKAPTVSRFFLAEHGHFVATAMLDGVRRLYTFHHVGTLPLYLSVGVAVDGISAAWRHKAIIIGASLLALSLTSLGLCLLFRGEMRRRMAAEHSLVKAVKRLGQTASTDGLTGIPNRRAFDEALSREWRRAVRNETALAVVMLDVDRFKQFNDRYGHQAGDETLRSVAACVSRAARRPADLAARYGGEEFVALLPDTEPGGALTVAESIRAGVANLALPHADSPTGYVTVSIGVAVARPGLWDTAADLVKEADAALYLAKDQGRNRVVSASDRLRSGSAGPLPEAAAT